MSKQLSFEDLTGGINNVDTKGNLNSSTKKTQTPDMVNVEYFQLGGIKSMEGNTQVGDTQDTAIVGGWEYVHKNKRDMIIGTKHGDVKIYNEQYNTFDTIYTFPSNSDRMSFCNMNNGVVVTNGKDDLLFYDNTRDTQLTGSVSVTNGSSTITGDGTKFTKQLSVGIYITIQNCIGEYKVNSITSDTSLTLDRNIELEQGVLYRAWSGEEQSIIVETTGTVNVSQGEPVTVDLDTYSSYPYTYTAVGNGVNKRSTTIQGSKFICNGKIYYTTIINGTQYALREYSKCGSNNTCVSNNLFIGNGGNLYKFNGYSSNPTIIDNTGGWTIINDYIGIKNGKLYNVYNTPMSGLTNGITDTSGVEEWTYICEGTLYVSGIIGTGPILYAIGDGELYKLVINFTDNSSTITKITNANFVNNKWGKILGYSYSYSGNRPYYLTAHALNNGNLYRIYSTTSSNVVTKIGSSNLWTEITGYSDLASGEYTAQVVGIYNGELRIINNPSQLDGTTTTTTLIDTDVKDVCGYIQYPYYTTDRNFPLYISNNGALKTLRYDRSQNATIPVIIDSSNIFTKLLQCNAGGKYDSTDDYYYTRTIFASVRNDNKCIIGGIDVRGDNPLYYPIDLLDTTIYWEKSSSSPTFDYLNLNVSNTSSGDTIEINFDTIDKTYYDLYETFGEDVYYEPNNSSELNNVSYLTTGNEYISFKTTETNDNTTTYKYGTYYRNKDSDSLNSSEIASSSNLIFKLGSISLIPTIITDTDPDHVDNQGNPTFNPINFNGLAIQYYKGRLWIGGTDDEGNGILVYSAVGLTNNPFDLYNDAGYFEDMYNDSSPVLALGLFSDFMTIHKEFNTYLLTDSGSTGSENAMQITPFSNITCKSQQSWIVSNTKYFVYSDEFNDIYPLVQHTVWNDRFLGEPISQKIRNIFNDIRQYDTENIFCVSRPTARQMIFYMPMNSHSGSNYAIIYDFQTKSWLLRVVPQEVTIAFNCNNKIYIGTSDGKILEEFSGDSFDGEPIVSYYKSPWFDWLSGYTQSFAEFCLEVDTLYNNNFYLRTQKDGVSRYQDRYIDSDKLLRTSLVWGSDDDITNTTKWDNDIWARQTFDNIRMLLPNNVFEDFQFEIGTNQLGQGFAIYGYKFRRIEAEEAPW